MVKKKKSGLSVWETGYLCFTAFDLPLWQCCNSVPFSTGGLERNRGFSGKISC